MNSSKTPSFVKAGGQATGLPSPAQAVYILAGQVYPGLSQDTAGTVCSLPLRSHANRSVYDLGQAPHSVSEWLERPGGTGFVRTWTGHDQDGQREAGQGRDLLG